MVERNCMSDITRIPKKAHGAEIYALNPDITAQQVADKLGLSVRTVENWKQDPNFIDAIYKRYMIEFGGELPAVLNAMVREAKAGNVQAGRLVLEHSGKLVKNINVTVDSPFEKYMKKIEVEQSDIEDAEVEEIIDSIPIMDTPLPERNTESQYVRAKREKKKVKDAIMDEKKKSKYLNQRREWYRWKKRAEAVGIEPLAAKRPTKGQRVAWQEEIIRRENEKENS